MDTLLQQYLNELKSNLYQMASCVEEAILLSTKALAKRDLSQVSRVFELENEINEFHKKIDHDCFKLLARQSPVASDLRLIIVATKMSVDLERMGDLACSISYSLEKYLSFSPVTMASEIPKMSDVTRLMIRKGLDALMQNDKKMALEVLTMDQTVDDYRDRLVLEIKSALKLSNTTLEAHLELFTIVRNLERLGDHATNIAEEVIFLISGEDVRQEMMNVKNTRHKGEGHE